MGGCRLSFETLVMCGLIQVRSVGRSVVVGCRLRRW